MNVTPLAKLLRAKIRANGPIPLSDFMADALGHPTYGYYRGRDPFGRVGDFITAPEISQIFGELIGLWCVVVWHAMAEPDPVILCEMGPGRGTMMADLLRAAAMDAGFRKAARIHLVETSPALRARQKAALAHEKPVWHDALGTVPRGPMLAVANEFFDALPIRQFVRRSGVWRERVIALAEGGDEFTMVDGPEVQVAAPAAGEGAILERGDAAAAVAAELGARLARDDGAALIIDYAHARTAPGDTLQAVRGHARAEPLEHPGEVDITAHVDFEALGEAAQPARAWGPVTQAVFLRALGIELRADRLKRSSPEKSLDIDSGCRRLIDPRAMGTLFKVLAIAHPHLAAPPGFE